MANPFLFICIFVALSLFYYVNSRIKNRKHDQRERLQEARKQWLESLLASKKEDDTAVDSGTPDVHEVNQ